MNRSRQLLLVICLAALSACIGPSRRMAPLVPDRRADDAPAIQTRIQLKETYIFNVGLTLYMLPYGPYYPEGQDERGIYYRAPIPIVRRGLLGGESFVQGGIYVPTDVTWSAGLVWLYLHNDDGSIRAEAIPGPFGMTYGDRWYRETYIGSPPPAFEELQATVAFAADGRPEGPYELRDKAGRVYVKGTFAEGRKEGVWVFTDSGGVKLAEITYRRGLRNGPCQMWYGSFAFPASAGKKKLAVAFDADQMHGEKVRWRKDGSTRCKTLFNHGAIVEAQCWDTNGVEMSESDARKLAREELKSDKKWFRQMDEEIDRSLRDRIESGGADN